MQRPPQRQGKGHKTMHKNDINNIHMGSADAAINTTRFWNIVQESEEEAEITIYGEIVARRPTDWWTGEPLDGLFTSPEGFLEDLAKVKDTRNITVRINSVGGDLYTAIGISNRLKELVGNTVAVIDGIAASAATVIAMGCDMIKAYPGSLFMVHEAMTTLVGAYNHRELMEVNKRLEAANAAAAETYHSKTKLGIEKIRNIMAKESWMTGRKAKEDGWIDEVIEGDDPEMSLSADGKMLTVNGITMSVTSFSNMQAIIPVTAIPAVRCAIPQQETPEAVANKDKKVVKEVGKRMTLEELKQTDPELVEQIRVSAESAARNQAIAEERERLKGIQEIAAMVGDREMVKDAMYGENACTASELALRAMQKQAKLGMQHLSDQAKDFQMSGAERVSAVPNGGNPAPEGKTGDSDMSEEDAVSMIAGTYKNKMQEGK